MGHMASDRDLRDDVTEQVNSYVMSNMSPQFGGFNGGVWLRLEELGRAWAEQFGTVYITSGAVFNRDEDAVRDLDEDAPRVATKSGTGRVGIPSHFYKVFLRKVEEDGWSSISFLLKHRPGNSGGNAKGRLTDAIKSMEEIESSAEIDLHPDLDRELVDQSKDWRGWGYASRRPNDESTCES
ncbi:MAG: DNA/RNA non-specific endonuclease [Rhodospirillales bacterium]|nr:DNA/RNA non-specific endonuclease [Rhodospirillales bacterium]